MEFIVEKSDIRLDKYLVEKLPELSRTKIQSLIEQGRVKIDGVIAEKSSRKLTSGLRIELGEDYLVSGTIKIHPENMHLEIVYEDNDALIVNKPAGIITHPTEKNTEHTLVNGLLYHYPEIKDVGDNALRPGILHRLDKDTSGLIIVAKNQKSFEFIKKQFLAREVKKKYLALIEGLPEKNIGSIEYDIRPSSMNRLKKVAVKKKSEVKDKSHRSAKTSYEVKEIFGDKFSLLEVTPLTGRTHQIRVHLSAIGHPIVGDILYGSKSKIGAKRQMLHATSISFIGLNGKKISVAIDPPKDFQKILELLKNKTT